MSNIRVLGLTGMVFALMATAAAAAPITYNIDFTVAQGDQNAQPTGVNLPVTGTLTTDGKTGTLMQSDIKSVSVSFDGKTLDNVAVNNAGGGDFFTATADGKLVFTFESTDPNNANRLIFNNSTSSTYIQLFDQGSTAFVNYSNFDSATNTTDQSFVYQTAGSTLTVGTTTAVSNVPLPASAPMFGAALVALGAIGYGVKRKGKAA